MWFCICIILSLTLEELQLLCGYLSAKNLPPPTTDRQAVAVAARIMHSNPHDDLARQMADVLLSCVRVTSHTVRAMNRTHNLWIVWNILPDDSPLRVCVCVSIKTSILS